MLPNKSKAGKSTGKRYQKDCLEHKSHDSAVIVEIQNGMPNQPAIFGIQCDHLWNVIIHCIHEDEAPPV